MTDFHYDVSLDYETDHNCSESGCDDEGICRCGTISNVRVERVDSWDIARHYPTGDIIHDYAVERLISRFRTDEFDIEVGGGYYGDEIDGVTLTNAAQDSIHKAQALITTAEQVEHYLALENGEVLHKHRDRQWEHVKIPIDDVIPGKNRAGLDKKQIAFYRDKFKYDKITPTVLCEKKGHDKYVLIDGYHRYHAALEANKKKIDVIFFVSDARKVADFELGGAL